MLIYISFYSGLYYMFYLTVVRVFVVGFRVMPVRRLRHNLVQELMIAFMIPGEHGAPVLNRYVVLSGLLAGHAQPGKYKWKIWGIYWTQH